MGKTTRKANRPAPWQPMRCTNLGKALTDEQSRIVGTREVWMNDRYMAFVTRDDEGNVRALSIKRHSREPANDWRHLQRIKNDIAGPECEAINLHPAESRLVDTANQRWLWVFPPGVVLPLGFDQGRVVADHDDPEVAAVGAKQRRQLVEVPVD